MVYFLCADCDYSSYVVCILQIKYNYPAVLFAPVRQRSNLMVSIDKLTMVTVKCWLHEYTRGLWITNEGSKNDLLKKASVEPKGTADRMKGGCNYELNE